MDHSSPSPSVAVIVVSYFTGAVLFDAIEALLAQPELEELLLVDNGNPKDVVDEILVRAKADTRLRLLTGHGNVGFARGCNLGAKAASSPNFLFLNPDCELPVGGLALLLAAGQALSRPWLISGRLIDSDGREQQGSRRAELTPETLVVEGLRLDRILPRRFGEARFNLHQTRAPADISPVPVVSGACFFLPRDDFWAIGGWDEGYFLHVEDIDFCHRFRKAGGEIYHLPQLVIAHHKGSSDAPTLKIEWHKTKGFFRYFDQHFRSSLPPGGLTLLRALIFLRFLAQVPRALVASK